MKLKIALLSAAVICAASMPAQASRTVTIGNGAPSACGGHVEVTARGFGNAKTTLTIYATNTPGMPGTMVIGSVKNSGNFAKASIPWYFGTQAPMGANVTIRVVGPKGNSAKGILYLAAYDNFSWGNCPW